MREQNIFYLSYSHNEPTGGQKQTYRHVDILNKYGYQAYALHQEKNFRLTWFENQTKVVDFDNFLRIHNRERDYIVVPEDMGMKVLDLPGKKVIFNKNVYYGFRSFGARTPAIYPYLHTDVVAILSVSDHNMEYLRFAYPGVDVIKVHQAIDHGVFRFGAMCDKKRQIAVIPKSETELLTLYHILQSRAGLGLNKIKEYEWVILSKKSEKEVSLILRDSLIFVFLSIMEGLPFTPIEAMASGCLIAAYGYGPTKEVVPPEFQFEYGDLIGIARYIEAVTNSFPEQMEQWASLTRAGCNQAFTYSHDREEASVVQVWDRILQNSALGGPPK
jgi:glycosyltransferase involved in cell wall biosynthesis